MAVRLRQERPSVIGRFYHTVRYLKPVQIYGRIAFRVRRPKPDFSAPPSLRRLHGVWVAPARREPSMLGPVRYWLLNREHDIGVRSGWDDPQLDKLWLYNLHYFDDLNARGAQSRSGWHQAALTRWVAENLPGQGTAWEPYPTSLRIVNWVKWAMAANTMDAACLHSLAVQARWLTQRLEIHLLGNHLFANAKALVFAGCFFDGAEAAAWLDQGLAILRRELPAQILADGGHFELSPMYHSLALEDVLDLLNLGRTYRQALADRWPDFEASLIAVAERMRRWLALMCHPDGEIAFFNDAAIGVAPAPIELEGYTGRLGLTPLAASADGVFHLPDSGYVRIQLRDMVALLDVAAVGPDYLPGHAHADTLSFELSLYGRRAIVNSGVSCYGLGTERLRQRGTGAHNTVTVNGENSSEVWGGFRVARRAYPSGLLIEGDDAEIRVSCAHNGYRRLPGAPVHRREWRIASNSLTLTDKIEGRFGTAVGRLHFAPDMQLSSGSGSRGSVAIVPGRALSWQVEDGQSEVIQSTYHPQFGLAQTNSCLQSRFTAASQVVRLLWN
jgi:uncharacterized heparinase superfamily protein